MEVFVLLLLLLLLGDGWRKARGGGWGWRWGEFHLASMKKWLVLQILIKLPSCLQFFMLYYAALSVAFLFSSAQ